ncbi:hypothetical protein LCGC14_0294560 [marine sediment metagenome]|uniref:Uncharacterized protein n=1 Tax=marine sediment metagenome TaxID=412755 RepID=A0A0F9WXS8_9ZZZZ
MIVAYVVVWFLLVGLCVKLIVRGICQTYRSLWARVIAFYALVLPVVALGLVLQAAMRSLVS